jgi:hypothetical protein
LTAETSPEDALIQSVSPLLQALTGQVDRFELTVKVDVPIDGKRQTIVGRLLRFDDESFRLELKHSEYEVLLQRNARETAFVLPLHRVVFLGRGQVDSADRLAPRGVLSRLLSPRSTAAVISPILSAVGVQGAGFLLTALPDWKFDPESGVWNGSQGTLAPIDDGVIEFHSGEVRVRVAISNDVSAAPSFDDWPGYRVVELDRVELERQLARGVRRASEILAPAPILTIPPQTERKVDHGELRWIGGQRVALLQGSPEEVGQAHGELLKSEAQACIDSVLFTFGTAQTIRTGRWFRHDLEAAYKRLAPHIPERHKVETRAMAAALGLDEQLVEALNVFPELFHCSGFAVFGKATKDGKLYHGRVLDYMTAIGLQDAATTFIIKVDGQIPFANVGYAGFIGSVSGMNARAISLGEMGGRGEGQWDGAPMATLMRRALEECDTLDEVMDLWKNSPRTCEYYYVFADGKTNRAVGVSALPESIEFILPGQTHPRLGEGIEDVVVLSSGSRLEKLRERVEEKHGQFDVELGKWLMSRPVAMKSNLHNVLFVPADGVLYVANADHKSPAAERPYVRLDLTALLNSMTSGDQSQSE